MCSGKARSFVLQIAIGLALACNSQPMNGTKPPPSRSPQVAAEHASADAVIWTGQHAVVIGSAGRTDASPENASPIFADNVHYHGWLRSVDMRGQTAWTHRLDAGRELHLRAITTLGADLVIAGEQRTGGARAYTGWLSRIAPDGSPRWLLDRLGGTGATTLQAVVARPDGGVLAGGFRDAKAWLTAVDPRGKPAWDRDLELGEVTGILAAPSLTVVVVVTGRTTTAAGTSRLIAVDASGAPRWTTALPDHGAGELFGVAPLASGGVAVGQAPSSGRDGAWIVRFAPDGAILSSQVLPAATPETAQAVTPLPDGGFLVAGASFEPRRARVWRFDAAGQLRWHKTYGDASPRGVAATPDGGAVLAGSVLADPTRAWIFAIGPDGAERWTAP
jgi:hypothetical protein